MSEIVLFWCIAKTRTRRQMVICVYTWTWFGEVNFSNTNVISTVLEEMVVFKGYVLSIQHNLLDFVESWKRFLHINTNNLFPIDQHPHPHPQPHTRAHTHTKTIWICNERIKFWIILQVQLRLSFAIAIVSPACESRSNEKTTIFDFGRFVGWCPIRR